MRRTSICCILVLTIPLIAGKASAGEVPLKKGSAFYPRELIDKVKTNADKYPWAVKIRDGITGAAKPWMDMSDDELWGLMFGSTITRSWMVWSNGYCPACKEKVPMYNWEIDAFERPWKVRCPHCKKIFPTNDFEKFYRSGLDEHGVFDPKKADRKLLFNAEHPGAKDPRRGFGVDDGEGYREKRARWRFIGAYLVYGQWKQLVFGGIKVLSAAYAVTGDAAYAHKAGVLLDRVADLYPTFEYAKQGLVYERNKGSGYVTIWHDAAKETLYLVIAYDQIFEAIREDADLVSFLGKKAREHKLENPKASFADVQRNIEGRILRDALANRKKIRSNVPATDLALIAVRTVLGWPGNRDAILKQVAGVTNRYFRVDGTTGEKGLSAYCAHASRRLAIFLERYAASDPAFLEDVFKLCPQLPNGYRFFIDAWCMQKYYPLSGDCGAFSQRIEKYCGVGLPAGPDSMIPTGRTAMWAPLPPPSMYSFLMRLHRATKDPAFVQIIHGARGGTADDLPLDIYADDPAAFRKSVKDIIDKEGAVPRLTSTNKTQWHLAILRSGEGENARAVWLDYDTGGNHCHADGMNLGLFAKGLDLMPDCGYRLVQFGGWKTRRSDWYVMTASHNTVVIDGKDHRKGGSLTNPASGVTAGKTTLWADGRSVRVIRASGPRIAGAVQYERTIVLVDVSDEDFYVIDIFRVIGGKDHARFMHSSFGTITTQGLSLKKGEAYGHRTIMRNFRTDPSPAPGWSAEWKIQDLYEYLPKGSDVRLRLTDFTTGAEASTAEGWVVAGPPRGNAFDSTLEMWIPRIMVRRRAEKAPLESTFVCVIEPHQKKAVIRKATRLPLHTGDGTEYPDGNVALEIELADGRKDILIAADVENPRKHAPSLGTDKALIQRDRDVALEGEMCLVRRGKDGTVERIALCRGGSVRAGKVTLRTEKKLDILEAVYENGKETVVSGKE